MEKIFLIGAAGFIFLSVYNHRTGNRYSDSNSNKFLVLVFVWGIFPYVVSEYLKGLSVLSCLFSHNGKGTISAIDMAFLILCSLFLGMLLSFSRVIKIWKWIKKWCAAEPSLNDRGLIGYDFQTFIQNEDIVILTLKNSKVYVGYVQFIDISEDIHQEQRTIKILPLKSGHRDSNGDVHYKINYLSAIGLEDKDNKVLKVFSEIPHLVIFQREVVSYTKYDPKLDSYFSHDEV